MQAEQKAEAYTDSPKNPPLSGDVGGSCGDAENQKPAPSSVDSVASTAMGLDEPLASTAIGVVEPFLKLRIECSEKLGKRHERQRCGVAATHTCATRLAPSLLPVEVKSKSESSKVEE